MNPQRDRKILELFEVAVDLEPRERARFLDRACAGDAALQRRLNAMLDADAESTRGLLRQPVIADDYETVVTPPPSLVDEHRAEPDEDDRDELHLAAGTRLAIDRTNLFRVIHSFYVVHGVSYASYAWFATTGK